MKRRISAGVSALALAGAGLVALPATTHASATSFDCTGTPSTPFELTLTPGEIKTVTFVNCKFAELITPLTTLMTWSPANQNGNLGVTGAPGLVGSGISSGTSTWDYDPTPSPEITFYAPDAPQDFTTTLKFKPPDGQNASTELNIKVEESGGSSSTAESSAGVGPAAHIQQFPKSSSMTCDEAQPEGLNWSGAPSGGWGESWAQWPNDGRGGEVCVRTLFYNTSTGKWDVR